MLQVSRRRGARFTLHLLGCLLALGLAPVISAQSATAEVRGQVINADTGLGVSGATVTALELGATAITDLSGSFTLRGLPVGTQSILVEKEEFQPTTVSDIAVTPGNQEVVRLPLTPLDGNVVVMEAFTVSADVLADSGLGLLLSRQKSVSVSDAIASDEMSRLGIGDAAEALSKTPGTSIVDGKYVIIRGLGDRYTNTQMNGSSVPSADPDRRAVQMDQFPSDLIDSVTTLKSFTPDQPGAFSGGSVNIKTKSFPEAFLFSASLKAGYNDSVTGKACCRFMAAGPTGRRRTMAP